MNTCRRCAHADRQGWWGPPYGLTHCRHCHRDWPMGSPQAHCVTCCEHFSAPGVAELHLTAAGCRPPGELTDKHGTKRLVLDHDKHGPLWRKPGKRPLVPKEVP